MGMEEETKSLGKKEEGSESENLLFVDTLHAFYSAY